MSDIDPIGEKWKTRYEREKKARQQAELLLEEKSSQLYYANLQLEQKIVVESSKYKREEEKFAALFRYSKDGIIIQDHVGKILDANQTICKLLGKTHEELVGSQISSIPSRDSIATCIKALRKIINTGNTRFACHLLDSNNKKIPVDIAATRLRFGSQTIIQGIIRDMTANQKAAKDLKVATNTAIKANEAKSLFLATMSHEIRTPLNGIIGFTNLLLQSEVSTEQQEHLSLIKKSGDILLNIINDILDFSRIESGQIELEHVDYDLTESIEDILDIHSQTAAMKQVDLLYFIQPNIPRHIHGDSGRLKQILLNLVSNGLKFTEHGAVSIEVKKPSQNFIQFSVNDTGIGFTDEIKEQLFQPFQQADASTTRKYGGTGLGLAICRQLTDAMGGTISANSKVGKGSEFVITIPLLHAKNKYQLNSISTSPLKGIQVFILDDNPINLDFMRARLTKWGCVVTTSDSPREALAILDNTIDQFDLILVDMLMPDMDGFQFAKEYSASNKTYTPPMILVTSSREATKTQVLKSGFDDLIYKPVKENMLMNSMLQAIAQKSTVTEHTQIKLPSDLPPPEQEVFALIVEDNHINAKLAKLLIERIGIIVHVAHNGEEALAALAENKFYHIIFMDMQMPVMDGIESTKQIRKNPTYKHYKDIPIIAMTANVLPEDEAKCIAAGMNSYITKPIDIQKVEQWLQHYKII